MVTVLHSMERSRSRRVKPSEQVWTFALCCIQTF